MRTQEAEASIYKVTSSFRRLGNPGSKNCRPIAIHYHPYFLKPVTSTEEQRKQILSECLSTKSHNVWAPREGLFNRKAEGQVPLMRSLYAGLSFLRL